MENRENGKKLAADPAYLMIALKNR